jgi:beta propeller repeat protein
MEPIRPPHETLFSKLLVIGVLVVLLVILGACVYVIYGYVSPPPDPDSIAATPVPTATPTHTPTPTPTPMPTPTPQPTVHIDTSPTPTPTPTPDYQRDVQITNGIKVMSQPGIWEKYVVYDEMIGNNNYKVHLYDSSVKTDIVIATGNIRSYGCIGSGKVGLLDEDTTQIWLYDIGSRTKVQSTPGNKIPRMYPSISNNRLIYTGNDGSYNPVMGWKDIFTLYEYEFESGQSNMLKHDMPEPNEPRVDGNYIVWWEIINGRNIVLYDKVTCKSKIISAAGAGSDHPRISGNTVVYHSVVAGADHIYSYDITSGTTRSVSGDGMQYYADVSGSKVVYDDNRDGKWDIFLFDRNTMQESRLTNEPHDQMMPQIYGNRIIYMDNRNYDPGTQGWDLYILEI